MAYTGVFRMGMAHDVAIVPFRTSAGWMLMMANVQTDALRFLAPAGADEFTAGPETVLATPVTMRIRAHHDGPVIPRLTVAGQGMPAPVVARRIAVETLPVAFTSGQTRLRGFVYRPRLLARPAGLRKAASNPQRIPVVDLLQNAVRKVYRVELP